MNKVVRLAARILKKIFGERFYQRTNVLGHTLEAWTAAAVNGFPGKRLAVIGVTGTNGKTTTVNYIAGILEAAGYKVGVSSTVNFRIGDEEWENDLNMTVTNPWTLQKLLKRMHGAGVDWVVLEVTSHTLHQGRASGVTFDMGVITNLTPDHLDYHGTVENYAAAKAKLLSRAKKAVVLNRDDEWYAYFRQFSRHAVYTYGTDKEASVRLEHSTLRADGSKLRLRYGERIMHADLHMAGMFNVYNALAAATVAFGLDIKWQTVQRGLEQLRTVSGRMEPVREGQDYSIIIDYAHTPDAFEKVLSTLKTLTKGRLIAVFGGTPIHDYRELGEVAARLADEIVVTDDEPMDEDPARIRRSIITVAEAVNHAQVSEVGDRLEAIGSAFARAQAGDTVVLLAFGHQKYRRVAGGRRIPWNDRAAAEKVLRQK